MANIETCNHCFEATARDIKDIETGGAEQMSQAKFEPFGEPLPHPAQGFDAPASSLFSRVGQSVFWLLAVSIVLARVFWMSPNSPF